MKKAEKENLGRAINQLFEEWLIGQGLPAMSKKKTLDRLGLTYTQYGNLRHGDPIPARKALKLLGELEAAPKTPATKVPETLDFWDFLECIRIARSNINFFDIEHNLTQQR